MIAGLAQVPPNCGYQDSKDKQILRYKINYWKHFPELPNNVWISASFVACNHNIIQARFSARLLNKQESTRFSARLLNWKIVSEQCSSLHRKSSEDSTVSECIIIPVRKIEGILIWPNLSIGSHLVNQNDPVTQERLQSPKTNSSIQYLFSVTYDGYLTTKQHTDDANGMEFGLCKFRTVQSRL